MSVCVGRKRVRLNLQALLFPFLGGVDRMSRAMFSGAVVIGLQVHMSKLVERVSSRHRTVDDADRIAERS